VSILRSESQRRLIDGKEIRIEGQEVRKTSYAQKEEGHAEERQVQEEGEEPQAGNRDRALRSAQERGEGPQEKIVEEKEIVTGARLRMIVIETPAPDLPCSLELTRARAVWRN
jgi:hypothetical protein